MALTNIRRLNIFKKNWFLLFKDVEALHINCSHPFQGRLFSEALGFRSWHFEAVVGMWKIWINEGRLFLCQRQLQKGEAKMIWQSREGIGGTQTPSIPSLPKTNIAPEDGWLTDYFHFGKTYFQGRVLLVSGRVRTGQLQEV